ncbi:siroheme synthase CysG [Actibacterium sp. 188UL27-1]|uniref:siroheme synthase CysG n=1 Tax=Actibacterium sp. 188UL27-1 TaxID=2786961 RepID=UPI0019579520|nr:siroheme synthase CysG [Actibacterium sp. 188UL27-1]MBM7068878.1 uroporphyrinogen-III C-methyltransferase [Actibacterium sp. 188UL27-1]
MKTFPMFLKMAGRRVVIAGGGEQAAQKCRLILKTEAKITILAPALEDELRSLVDEGRISWSIDRITPAIFGDTALVFVATGCPGIDAALHDLAKTAGAVTNVVDQPELCDALTPSIVDRDPVVVAIGTEGTAPVLARQIKTQLEQNLEPRLGDLAALAGRLRDRAAMRLGPKARRDLWRWVFGGEPRADHARGAERAAARRIKDAIETGDFTAAAPASVALVGAGPGSRDLITLRAVQRLQEADVVFYDRLVDPDVLELARRDAERVCVGKEPGCHNWPQDRINGVLVAAAKQGKRVVRLKCGDPGVFSRGAEEIAALKLAGLSYEIVPGVTAASAAAATAGTFLTERGKTDTVVLTTGTTRDNTTPDWIDHLARGTRVAVYMGINAAPQLEQDLRHADLLDETEVLIVSQAGHPGESITTCAACDLAQTIAESQIPNPAIIFLTRCKYGEPVMHQIAV